MGYVLKSWRKASHDHMRAEMYLANRGPEPPEPLYERLFREWQDRIMMRAHVSIACDPDEPSVILGYAVHELPDNSPPVIHYVQVKRDLQRKGVASALLEHAQIRRESAAIYTFTSPIFGKVKPPQPWVYVPYWLMDKS